MFTGIVRGLGEVRESKDGNGMKHISVDMRNLVEPKLGASVSIDGTCLTVASANGTVATFDVIRESLDKTTLGWLKPGHKVNVEPPLSAGEELGGHIILGHVDCRGKIEKLKREGGDVVVTLSAASGQMKYIKPKGSIAVDGISLTIVDVFPGKGQFTVALIPETLRLTTLGFKKVGDEVNIETDYLAKIAYETFASRLDSLEERIAKLEGKG